MERENIEKLLKNEMRFFEKLTAANRILKFILHGYVLYSGSVVYEYKNLHDLLKNFRTSLPAHEITLRRSVSCGRLFYLICITVVHELFLLLS